MPFGRGPLFGVGAWAAALSLCSGHGAENRLHERATSRLWEVYGPPPDVVVMDALTPDPPFYLAPKPLRPELLVDDRAVFLADPDGNLIGIDGDWGRGGVLARLLYAGRSGTRDL